MKKEKFEELGGILPVQVCWKPSTNIQDAKTLWGPFKKIPNVRTFKVIVGDPDPVFLRFHLTKRLPAQFDYEPHVNAKYNRYLEHQFKRMKYVNSLTYWRMSEHLMKRSGVFLTLAINHVVPQWSRKKSISSVIRLALETRRIAFSDLETLDYSRVYIDKTNGKIRPLGVPTLPWRVYLHMLNQLLVNYLDSRNMLHNSQHGFRPNRGTLSAWQVVLRDVLPCQDIYEFDLKNFFGLVDLASINEVLLSKGIPKNIVDKLYYINASGVKVKRKARLNEFEATLKSLLMKNLSIDEFMKRPIPLTSYGRTVGVPQGANTSPILATLLLENSILDRGLNCVMYADDGLYYSLKGIDQPIITPNTNMVKRNIHFNLEKTDYVKRDGVWLKPLKFLGLTYDGVANTLTASTRKGSTLKYDKEDLVTTFEAAHQLKLDGIQITEHNLQLMIDHIQTQGDYDESWGAGGANKTVKGWEDLIKSKLWGWIQSRLYAGSWDVSKVIQDFRLGHEEGKALCHLLIKRRKSLKDPEINVFNVTTFASEWLIKKLASKRRYRKYRVKPFTASA